MSGFQGRGRGRHWHRPPGGGDIRGGNRAPWLFGFQPHFNQNYSPHPQNSWHGPSWDKRTWRFPAPSSSNSAFSHRSHVPYGQSGWEYTPPQSTSFRFGTDSEVNESPSVLKDSDSHKSKSSGILPTPKDILSAPLKCETRSVKEKEESFSYRNQRSEQREKKGSDVDLRRRDGENRHRSRSDERIKDVKNSRTVDVDKRSEESESRRSKASHKGDSVAKSDQKPKPSSSRSVYSCASSATASTGKLYRPLSPSSDSRKYEQNKQQNKILISKQSKSPVTKQSKPVVTKQSKTSTTSTSKSPNLEDARKNHISKAADRLKKFLQDCKESKDEVLENLLSKVGDSKAGPKLPGKQCFNPDLQLTAKDLSDIGKIKSNASTASQRLVGDDSEILILPPDVESVVLANDGKTVGDKVVSDAAKESSKSVKVSIEKGRLSSGNKKGISQKTGENKQPSKEHSSKKSNISTKSSESVKQSAPATSLQSSSSVQSSGKQSSGKQQTVTERQPSGSNESPSRAPGPPPKEKPSSSRVEKFPEKVPSTRSIFQPNITPSRSRHTSDSAAPNSAEKHSIEVTQDDALQSPAKRAKRSRSDSINADEQESSNRRKSFSGSAGANSGPNKSIDEFKQQLFKMNLKDVVTNPNYSRKAEMVMQHLMKEHSQTINRQLRMLAESRLTGKQATTSAEESSNQLMQDPLELDTDLAVDLAALPPEFIENLQSIFQMELVDNPDASEVSENLVTLPFSGKEGELQNGDMGDVFNSAMLGDMIEPDSLLMMDQKIAESADPANLDEKLVDMNLEGNIEFVERNIEFLQNQINNFEEADPAIENRIKIENEDISVKEEIFIPEFISEQCSEAEERESGLLKDAGNSLFLGDSEEVCSGSKGLSKKDHSPKTLRISTPTPHQRKDEINDALGRSDSELIASDFLGESAIVTDAPSTGTLCGDKSFPDVSGNEGIHDLAPTFSVDSNLENDDQFAAYDMDSEIVPDDQDTGYVVENNVLSGQAGVYDVDNIENFADDQVSAYNVDDSMPSLGAADIYNVEGDQLAEYTMEDSSLAQDATLCAGEPQFNVETDQLGQKSSVLPNAPEQSPMLSKNSTPSYSSHPTPSYDVESREEPVVFMGSTKSPVSSHLPVEVSSCASPAVQKESSSEALKTDIVLKQEPNIKLVDCSHEVPELTALPESCTNAKDQPREDKGSDETTYSKEGHYEAQQHTSQLPVVPTQPEPAPVVKCVSFDACTQTEPPMEEEETSHPAVTAFLDHLKQLLLQPVASSSLSAGSSAPSFLGNDELLLQNIKAALQSHGTSQNKPKRIKKTGSAGWRNRHYFSQAQQSAPRINQPNLSLQRRFSYNSDSNSDAVMPVLTEAVPRSEVSSQWLRDRVVVADDDQVESEREIEDVGATASGDLGECSENIDVSDTMREMLRVDKEMQRLLAYKMKLYKKMYQRGDVLNARPKQVSCDNEMLESTFSSVREDLSLFDKSLQQLNEANASGGVGSNVIGVSASSVGGGDGGCVEYRQGGESKNPSRMEVETASKVCASPQTTSLTPARDAFGGSPSPSVPCAVPTPSSPASHCFRTGSESSSEVLLDQSRGESALCDSDSHLSSHIRASSTSAHLSQSLNSVCSGSVGAHQSPMGPVSKSPDCSDSVTQKSHSLQHNSVLVQSPPMVRFPADYCLSVCSTSNLHDVVNPQASIESLLNISECHPGNSQTGESSPACHQQLQAERNPFNTCVVEDVINSALSEQCDTNNSTSIINSPQKQSNTPHLMDVELTRTHSNKIDDQLKLTDTSVVEAVLSTFALPECNERRPENDLMSSPISESKAEPDSTDGGCEQGEPMIPSTTNSESEGGTTPPSVANNRSFARRGRRRAMSRFSNQVDIARDPSEKEVNVETSPLNMGEESFQSSHRRARRNRGRGRRGRGEGFVIRGSPSGHSPREANLTPKHTFDGESLENSDQQRSLHQPDSTRDTPMETPEVPETPTTPSRRRRKNVGQVIPASEDTIPASREEPKSKARKKMGVEPALIVEDNSLIDFPPESVEVEDKSADTGLIIDNPPRRQTRRRTKKVYPDDSTASESDPFITYPVRRAKKRKSDILETPEMPVADTETQENIEKSVKVDVPEKVEKVTKDEEKIEVEKVEKASKVEKVSKPEKVSKVEKAVRVEKIERVSKPEKVEKVIKVEKGEKLSKVEKVEKVSKVEKVEKTVKAEKVEKVVKPEKASRSRERVPKVEKPRSRERRVREKEGKEETMKELTLELAAPGMESPAPVESPSEEPLARLLVARATEPERVSTPVPKTTPTVSASKTRPSTPMSKTRPSTPMSKTRPATPMSKTTPATPVSKTRPATPLKSTPAATTTTITMSRTTSAVTSASKATPTTSSIPTKDGTIKDCYIVIKPIDISQYLRKSRTVESEESSEDEEEEEEDEEKEEERDEEDDGEKDDAVERVLERIRKENSAGSTPSDPTQEIESQLALLEELSSQLDESQSQEEEETAQVAAAGMPPTPVPSTPAIDSPSLHDDTSVSTLVSDCVSAPSDADVPAKRARLDALTTPTAAPLQSSTPVATPASSASPEDYDKDSVSSGDPDSPSKAQKHKSRKRKRRTDAPEHIAFDAHQGSVLDVKTVGRHVLAACEDGNVYCYSLKSGKLKRQYSGHTEAVVCISILEGEASEGEDPVPEFLYTGSLDKQLRCFQFKTGALVNKPVDLGRPIQCMDEMWGILFIGTKVGDVAKFYTKSFKLNEEFLKCGKDMILALKATKEGARKVIIIASRNEAVSVRDAHSGLLMRVIGQQLPIHTVYSLRLESSLLYCGTSSGKIPVFQFTTGEEVCKYSAGNVVVSMSIYNHLLFAGCYDGNIYVYSTQDKSLVTCIPGPGKMLLCLDVAKNRIIAGSKDNKLEVRPLPPDVKNCIRESKHR